jgi:YD repeat-containing protein
MNHLSGVTMPRAGATQTRTFVYDDSGRLTSATNPENGTVSYYYNSNNTLQYKHDAKGQDTVYTYDTQNRVTEIQRYANGKNGAEDMCQRVTYSYDTNPYDSTGKYQYTTGRLTAAVYPVCNVLDSNSNVSVTEMYSYHPAGAVTIKDLHIYKPWWNDAYGNWSDGWGDVEADYSYNSAGQTSGLVLPSALVPSGCCASVIAPGPTRMGMTRWRGRCRWWTTIRTVLTGTARHGRRT